MSKGGNPFVRSKRLREMFGGVLLISAVTSVCHTACAQGAASALPTFPPIAAPAMLDGSGPEFTEDNYQLIAPSLRKCANDWPSTTYVEYLPGVPGKVSISQSSVGVMAFLTALSEQTGRRFAVQRGVEREVPISANGEDWLPVLERYVDTAGLDLENVQDILVISDPKTAFGGEGATGRDIVIAILVVSAMGIGLGWHFFWPKKRVDPRGGWS